MVILTVIKSLCYDADIFSLQILNACENIFLIKEYRKVEETNKRIKSYSLQLLIETY